MPPWMGRRGSVDAVNAGDPSVRPGRLGTERARTSKPASVSLNAAKAPERDVYAFERR
jgi:hypothetical protein